jgi:RNA polymerase sigma-70 factor, ECF subfamily
MATDVSNLLREHAPFVWRVLRYRGVPADLLEDASQDVFLVVVRKLPEFRGESHIRTWIYGICSHVALQVRRRQLGWRARFSHSVPEVAQAPQQLQRAEERQTWAHLQRALAQLSEKKRMVFVLYELEDLPMQEVATAVGCNLSTAYSRLQAARSELAAQLRSDGGPTKRPMQLEEAP